MRKSEGNLIWRIRDATRLSQSEFGLRINRSLPSIQGYESGARLSALLRDQEAVDKLKEMAVAAGRPDLADALDDEDWTGERATELRLEKKPAAPASPSKHQSDHAMLEEILESGQPDAISAVRQNLEVFVDRVRLRKPKTSPKTKGRTG